MRIIVDSQNEKNDLMTQSEYIHFHPHLDSDKCNSLMHIYNNLDIIEVHNPNSKNKTVDVKRVFVFLKMLIVRIALIIFVPWLVGSIEVLEKPFYIDFGENLNNFEQYVIGLVYVLLIAGIIILGGDRKSVV